MFVLPRKVFLGPNSASFCLFSSFYKYNDKYTKFHCKSLNGVLGIRTRDRSVVVEDESTVLWRLGRNLRCFWALPVIKNDLQRTPSFWTPTLEGNEPLNHFLDLISILTQKLSQDLSTTLTENATAALPFKIWKLLKI